jgi:hypothetical protein
MEPGNTVLVGGVVDGIRMQSAALLLFPELGFFPTPTPSSPHRTPLGLEESELRIAYISRQAGNKISMYLYIESIDHTNLTPPFPSSSICSAPTMEESYPCAVAASIGWDDIAR